MIKEAVQKKNSNIPLDNSKNLALSIQFSLDGFSFCIKDLSKNTDIYFSEYIFENTINTPELLLKEIDTIFKKDANLQRDFVDVLVIHQNRLYTQVPNEFFREEHIERYLQHHIKTLKTDFISFDDLPKLNAKNVYIPYVNINNYLFQNFGEFEYKHHVSAFLEHLLLMSNIPKERSMYVNVSKHALDIIVLEDKELLLSNSFQFITKEDFIYYILFVLEQLEMNPAEHHIYFTGDIQKDSKIFEITLEYVKNSSFLESNNAIFNQLEMPKHSNYILLAS